MKCPRCPLCDMYPQFGFPTQVFCPNDDCKVLTWNPSKTKEEILASEMQKR